MRKIIISAVVTPNDDSVTLESLQDGLRHLGSAYFTFTGEVELADSAGLTKQVWLYVSSDDSEPYVQVSGPGETEGKSLYDDEVERLRANGVCIEFRAEYPRANKYGAPSYAGDEDFAAGVVGNHLFKVDAEGLSVQTQDRGDDGCEQFWLMLLLPE